MQPGIEQWASKVRFAVIDLIADLHILRPFQTRLVKKVWFSVSRNVSPARRKGESMP